MSDNGGDDTYGRRGKSASGSGVIAVAQFALAGVAAVILLGFGGVQVFRDAGKTAAIRDAKELTGLAGHGIVAPSLTPRLLAGDPAAIASLDRIVRTRVIRDPTVRVKIWDANGRILYSDMRALVGARYRLGDDEQAALRGSVVAADVSNLRLPENRFERSYGKLLEVYLGVRATNGRRVLFEAYQRYASVSASGQRLWRAFAPALIGGLLLLEFVQIPLAWSLARRLQRGQQEREALLRRAIEASETERRRIARDLHDGVVQNLAGVAFGLAATAEELGDGRTRAAVHAAADEIRNSLRALRTLLVGIYPPSLRRAGLHAALSDLLAPLNASAIGTTLEIPADLELPEGVEALLFRVMQECLRNVHAHADARNVTVRVRVAEGRAAAEVTDDGLGFDTSAGGPTGDGHFGLRMLGDLAREADGRLTVDSALGEGTSVRIEVPVS